MAEAGLTGVRNVLILMPSHVFNVSRPSEKRPQAAQTQPGGLRTRRKTVKEKNPNVINTTLGKSCASSGGSSSSWGELRVPGEHSWTGGWEAARCSMGLVWFAGLTGLDPESQKVAQVQAVSSCVSAPASTSVRWRGSNVASTDGKIISKKRIMNKNECLTARSRISAAGLKERAQP